MNCYTGEISNDPALIEAWRERGDRILHLPDAPAPAEERQGSVLLETLGVEVRNSQREAEERSLTAARQFVQRVNAAR